MIIRKILKHCIEAAKREYFEIDHHYYKDENGKEAEWKHLISIDEDVFNEYILPIIQAECFDLYELSTPESLYVFCKQIVNGEKKC